jgi:glycosyltransferase involved in cell wall biosynthesis
VLREDTKGSYAARNRGVRSASGAILAFTDADCVADASWLESILAAFEDPAVELICGLRRPASSSLPLSGAMDYETTKDQWVLGSGRPQIYYGYTCNLAVRRATFDAIGPFKPLLRGADTLFVREVAERHSCAVIRFVPGMAITHLEMGGLDAYFRKVGAYGFHRRLNNESGLPSRSLTFPERMSIFKETVRRHRYSMPRASLLFVTLCAGAAFWHAGALRARLKPAAPAPVTARSLREG